MHVSMWTGQKPPNQISYTPQLGQTTLTTAYSVMCGDPQVSGVGRRDSIAKPDY